MKHSIVKGLECALAALFKQAQVSNTDADSTTVRKEGLYIVY